MIRVAQFVDDNQNRKLLLADFAQQKDESTVWKCFINQSNQITRPVSVSIKSINNQSQNWNLIIIEDQTDDHQRNQSHNDFISTASHEMRTPLATIGGLSVFG